MNCNLKNGNTASSYVEHQEQTKTLHLSSKNLLNITTTTQTTGGITCTINADKTITLNGTSNTQVEIDIGNCGILKAGTYIGNCENNSSTSTYYIRLGKAPTSSSTWVANVTKNSSITLSEDTSVYALLIIKNGTTINNITIYPQIEKGSTATTYEPYYNYELSKIGNYQDRISKSSGKNILQLEDKAETTTSQVTYSCINGTLKLNGTANSGILIDFPTFTLPKGTYYLNRNNVGGSVSGSWQNYLQKYVGTSTSTVVQGSGTFTIDEEQEVFFRVYANSGTAFTNYVMQPMLNIGSTALPYEPYGTNWYIEKNIGKVVLNGSESWASYVDGIFYATLITDYAISGNIPYSNYYVGLTNVTGANVMINAENYTCSFINISGSTTPRFYIKNRDFSSIENLQTWLSTHNTTIYYALSTPTYTEITNTTLLTELNELEKMYSYNGTTNLNISGSLPMLLSVSALKGE